MHIPFRMKHQNPDIQTKIFAERLSGLMQSRGVTQVMLATGIGAGLGQISFAGVLTEHATASTTFTPAQGFAAAFHALSAVVPSPVIPVVTDIQVNG